ncbi:MAG: iron-sulfur cluster assembly accessory protein [Anaerolinea sp.]|nr:iron-sulfur cluster assembly accessory protein [Anaerolinea sp.]
MAVNDVNRIETLVNSTPIEPIAILNVTPAAVNVIKSLLEQRGIPGYALRVFVSGGGCSGLSYGMAFEQSPSNHDAVVEVDGVRLVVDPTSLLYLQGSTIDYVDSVFNAGFRIDNPNAVSSCGCGHSFRTKDSAGAESSNGCGSCSH